MAFVTFTNVIFKRILFSCKHERLLYVEYCLGKARLERLSDRDFIVSLLKVKRPILSSYVLLRMENGSWGIYLIWDLYSKIFKIWQNIIFLTYLPPTP